MNYIYTKPNSKINRKITFFCIPKPFIGQIGVIQYNAILSWTLLIPKAEIVLYGDEKGTAEIAKKLNLIHVPKVTRNEFGTPLLDGIFADIHHRASNDLITYINADIILTDDFTVAVNSVAKLPDFLIIGRRWNLDISEKIVNTDRKTLQDLIIKKGCLANYDCKDYFVFPKHLFAKIPAFAIGRGYWDTWMVRKALKENYPVIDASLAIAAIHQNHAYTHIRGGKNEAYMGKEATINKALGNVNEAGNIAAATWQLKPYETLTQPKISVVLIVNNYSAIIEKTLLSVLVQKYRDYEIIIIDRSYDERTPTILEPYQNEISYFFLEKGVALYNFILQVTRGELMIFLNENHILLPNTLEKQVDYLEREAATLDILLSGYKIAGVDNEERSGNDLPDLEKLAFPQLLSVRQSLAECLVVIRRCRLKTIDLASCNSDSSSTIIDIVFNLITVKGCRVKWWSKIAKIILPD